jgi:hypothetical protein
MDVNMFYLHSHRALLAIIGQHDFTGCDRLHAQQLALWASQLASASGRRCRVWM